MIAALRSSADRDKFIEVAEALPDLDALPEALIHFEMSLGNTIQRPDGTIVAVDWDEAGMGARVLDPGYFLISAFVSEDLSSMRMALAPSIGATHHGCVSPVRRLRFCSTRPSSTRFAT